MEALLRKINSLGSFEVNLLAAVVFGIVVVITRFLGKLLVKRLAESGVRIAKLYAENYLQKYLAHHAIFGSKEIAEPVRLFFLVILTSIAWLFLSALMLVFFYGVNALATGKWFIFLGHWFALNCLIEGFLWAKDSRNDKIPKAIYDAKFGKAEQKTTENPKLAQADTQASVSAQPPENPPTVTAPDKQ